jgi:arylsulfatase A-like enzyme/Tfp pilus assembly protein PilF
LHGFMTLRRLPLLALFFVGSLMFALAAPPNIILVTLDTTRADRMGFLGSQRGLTPNLDTLARQSAVFTHSYSQVPLTTASHATILTGTYPQFHQVEDAGMPLAKTVPYAPEILRRSGYQTAAFVGAVILDPAAGAPGFDRGFATYDARFRSRGPGEDRYKTLERRGDVVVTHALAWMNQHPRGPFFLWIHLYDPHAPYDPPEPFKTRYASEPYDGEIAYADSVVGKLLDQLRAKGLYDSSVIAVMADHGEALGEHGERGHGVFLYDPTIHVPLLLKLPGNRSAGKRVDAHVGLVDVMPTLLQAAGVPVPKAVQGESLLGLAGLAFARAGAALNTTPPERFVYAETDYPQRAYGWSALRSFRTSKYFFIEAPRRELYDQAADANSERNLASSAAAVADTLSNQLKTLRQQTSSSIALPKASLDPQQEARLRALGYVASSGQSKGAAAAHSGSDPKDKIEIANEMTEANLQLEDGHYQEAIANLERVVAADPNISAAYMVLGTAWSSVGDYQHAVPALRKAAELRPESVSAHYQLGMALFQTGDVKSAAPEFEAAVAGFPQSAEMHFSLAAVYVRVERAADAKRELRKSLQLKPNSFDTNLMLGQILMNEKNAALGLPYLRKAAGLQPFSARAHEFLADAYGQLGQKQNADRERALAERSKTMQPQ